MTGHRGVTAPPRLAPSVLTVDARGCRQTGPRDRSLAATARCDNLRPTHCLQPSRTVSRTRLAELAPILVSRSRAASCAAERKSAPHPALRAAFPTSGKIGMSGLTRSSNDADRVTIRVTDRLEFSFDESFQIVAEPFQLCPSPPKIHPRKSEDGQKPQRNLGFFVARRPPKSGGIRWQPGKRPGSFPGNSQTGPGNTWH